jgi:hypothetical protein
VPLRTLGHVPIWVTVKYRATPIDIASPRFDSLGPTSSSLVTTAYYDTSNRYMIIVLQGTAYHYCDVPSGLWSAFRSAASLGRFYNSQVKGQYDCRAGFVPEYGG